MTLNATPAPQPENPVLPSAVQPAGPDMALSPTRTEASKSGETVWATGRRKEAIARVRLVPGAGKITVNKRLYDEYFPRELWRLAIRQPLFVTHQLGKYDVLATVNGGGISGQAGAIRLGIARAILLLDPAYRQPLRSAGLLTRDPRMKERKKYGQKGARKRFQWTKR